MKPLGATWRKSTKSAQGNCVEAFYDDKFGVVLLRDTKAGGKGPTLSFTGDEWSAFVAGVSNGEFEISA